MPSICEIHVSLATYMLEVVRCCCGINLLASSSVIVVVVDAVAVAAVIVAAAGAGAAIKSARISVGRQEEINI